MLACEARQSETGNRAMRDVARDVWKESILNFENWYFLVLVIFWLLCRPHPWRNQNYQTIFSPKKPRITMTCIKFLHFSVRQNCYLMVWEKFWKSINSFQKTITILLNTLLKNRFILNNWTSWTCTNKHDGLITSATPNIRTNRRRMRNTRRVCYSMDISHKLKNNNLIPVLWNK